MGYFRTFFDSLFIGHLIVLILIMGVIVLFEEPWPTDYVGVSAAMQRTKGGRLEVRSGGECSSPIPAYLCTKKANFRQLF